LDPQDPTTEKRQPMLPPTLTLLRWELSQKAKQEPKLPVLHSCRIGSLGVLLACACGKGIWERRMREIRTSGVTREER